MMLMQMMQTRLMSVSRSDQLLVNETMLTAFSTPMQPLIASEMRAAAI
jgi:hypothetical protein